MTPGPKAPAHTEAALKLTLASRGQGAFWPGFPSNDSLFPGVGAGPVLCPEVPASACSYLTRFFFFFFGLRPGEFPFMGLKVAAQTWRAGSPWVKPLGSLTQMTVL